MQTSGHVVSRWVANWSGGEALLSPVNPLLIIVLNVLRLFVRPAMLSRPSMLYGYVQVPFVLPECPMGRHDEIDFGSSVGGERW